MTDFAACSDGYSDTWFVVWTRSRAEKQVERRLASLGLSPWLPVTTERHRWSDRWREVICPLFPGYVFARNHADQWGNVLRIPGVLAVVKRNGCPALMSNAFVVGLRDAIARSDGPVARIDDPVHYHPGDEVIIQNGALAGMRGVVRERRSGRQLVVWISEIARGVAFGIGSSLVKPATSAPPNLDGTVTTIDRYASVVR